ncbi:MAG: flagellar hook-basal body complex protein FliE [Ruminiclostridium sp.]|nr:flagellar hook-basal body complex protein FliE [Ruminiclostridium sp.]
MYIIPLNSNITPLQPIESIFPKEEEAKKTEETAEPTFLDAMKGLWDNAAEAQAVKNQDMVNLMLGDTDSLEQLQINITKAELATQLLVNVKNAAVDAYNEIMRMSI